MSWPAYSSSLRPRGYQPTAADKALKALQQRKAIKELWLIIAAILALLFVIRLLRLAVSSIARLRPSASATATTTEKAEKGSLEIVIPGRTGKPSWRRIPAALASAFRVVAFRIQVPLILGSASLTELFIIFGYIATMLSLALTNSELYIPPR